MSKLSRREFLKLSGLGLGALAVNSLMKKSKDATPEPNLEFSTPPEDAPFLTFHLENPIGPEIKEVWNIGVENLADMALERSKLNNPDDLPTLEGFNYEIFLLRGKDLFDCLVKIQTTYTHFLENETESKFRSLALAELKNKFFELALPMSLFHTVFSDESLDNKAKFDKLFSDYNPVNSECPVDPLIGDLIYDYVGNEPWFLDFDMAYQDGVVNGTYPFTRKFFHGSGTWFNEFSLRSGMRNSPDYPLEQSPKGGINHENYVLEDDPEAIQIPVDQEVEEDILLELERLGLDRSFSNLIFRTSHGNDFSGGVVYTSLTLTRNNDINMFRNGESLDWDFYSKYKLGILFTLSHEIFHVLSSKALILNPVDRYKLQSSIEFLNRALNPIYSRNEICGDSISLSRSGNIFDDNEIRTRHFSEGNRTSYLMQNMLLDVDGVWPVLSQLGPYRPHFDSILSQFINVRAESGPNIYQKYAAAKYSEQYFGFSLEKYVETNKDSLTHLDRFIFKELIDRFHTSGLYSEQILFTANPDTVSYYSSTLPLLLIYTSMARGDNHFIDSIEADLEQMVVEGNITSLQKKYHMRKINLLSKRIRHSNSWSFYGSSNAEEFMADQFAFALMDSTQPDTRNLLSGLKSELLINNLKEDLHNILIFFKSRNLAKVNTHTSS